jgi:hypothetical protein
MLEDRMKSLEEAIRENTAALLGKATKSKDKDDAGEEKPARRSRKDEDDADEKPRSRRSSKDKDEEEEKPARRSRKDEDDEKPVKKGGKLSIDDVRKAYADYLGPKDGKNYDANADFVEAVLNEVGADTLREIKEDDFAKAMHWLSLKKDGQKKIDFDNDLPDDEAEEKPRRRRSVED